MTEKFSETRDSILVSFPMLEYLRDNLGSPIGQIHRQTTRSDNRYFLSQGRLYTPIKGDCAHVVSISCPARILALYQSLDGYLHILTPRGCYYFRREWRIAPPQVAQFFTM